MKRIQIALVAIIGLGLGYFVLRTVFFPRSEPIDTSINILEEFPPELHPLLVRHLRSSAAWQVKDSYEQFLTVRRRERHDGTLRMIWNNRNSFGKDNGCPCSEIILRFEPYTPGTYGKREEITVAEPGSTSTRLKLDGSADSLYSTLVVPGPGLFLYINEGGSGSERPLTKDALQALTEELRGVLEHKEELLETGYIETLVPQESVLKQADPTIKVVDDRTDGYYNIFAYINPGEEGFVYLKVFDAQTETQLCPGGVAERSRAYTGWSQDLV